jgi:hypothetical protein
MPASPACILILLFGDRVMSEINVRATNFYIHSNDVATANNVDTNTITATLRDDATPVPGISVNFIVTAEGATFSNGRQDISAITNEAGICNVELKSEVAGHILVKAVCYHGDFISTQIESVFEEAVEGQETLTATVLGDNTAAADGLDKIVVVYSLKNGTAPVAGQYIFVNVSGSATADPTTIMTDDFGTASINITNAFAETVIVEAEAVLIGVKAKPVELIFEAVVSPYTIIGSIVSNNASADGTSTNAVLFKVTDTKTGAPAMHKVLNCIASHNLSLPDGQYHETDLNGEVTVSCTALVPAGDYSIEALLYPNSDTNCIVEGISFAKPEYIKDLIGIVVRDNAEATEGKGDYCQIQYSLTKANSLDAAEGHNIYIKVNSGNVTVSENKLITDSNGLASLKIYNSVAESVTVTATTDIEDISEETVVNFRKPVSVTSGTITSDTFCSLDMFTSSQYDFITGHSYQFMLSTKEAGDVKKQMCQDGYNIIKTSQSCQIISDPHYAKFNDFNYDGAIAKCTHGGVDTATNVYYQIGDYSSLTYTLIIIDLGVN